ncbi:hypothetical protein B0H14DRAFT_3141744 [Mycena olivaceomarginata]|nr:hypothetical protein B0H14DRAFT_3141744 [Mycena olivaceomarginata]
MQEDRHTLAHAHACIKTALSAVPPSPPFSQFTVQTSLKFPHNLRAVQVALGVSCGWRWVALMTASRRRLGAGGFGFGGFKRNVGESWPREYTVKTQRPAAANRIDIVWWIWRPRGGGGKTRQPLQVARDIPCDRLERVREYSVSVSKFRIACQDKFRIAASHRKARLHYPLLKPKQIDNSIDACMGFASVLCAPHGPIEDSVHPQFRFHLLMQASKPTWQCRLDDPRTRSAFELAVQGQVPSDRERATPGTACPALPVRTRFPPPSIGPGGVCPPAHTYAGRRDAPDYFSL